MNEPFSTIEHAIDAISRGEFVVVIDDANRENEGDLVIAAEKITPEKMSFLLQYTSGIICVPMGAERLDTLHLPPMVNQNTEFHRTAFTISVDARHGITTGISAADRTKTVRALADPKSTAAHFRRPGHIFPLRVAEGGVLKRAGHTEAIYDLVQLAGLEPIGVLSEIVNPDYSMARLPELSLFAKQHNIPLIAIADLIHFREQQTQLLNYKEHYAPT